MTAAPEHDWCAHECLLNGFPQYCVQPDDIPLLEEPPALVEDMRAFYRGLR